MNVIGIDENLMCPIQFQSVLVCVKLPNNLMFM